MECLFKQHKAGLTIQSNDIEHVFHLFSRNKWAISLQIVLNFIKISTLVRRRIRTNRTLTTGSVKIESMNHNNTIQFRSIVCHSFR
ncbi:protein ycf2 [Phtheirospermum japonicum]|uniref:Protein ycf2 n=1 Tax=Phtheirospermum japonicum TaxID=374723 RepID=A0A830BMS4_9LAMI|nr:protein ycf2 [Phtheirospermum japonicum]